MIIAALIVSLLGIFNNANAAESKDKVKLSQPNESTLHIEERDGVTSTQDDKGVVTLKDQKGKTEKLPTEAKDKDDNDVVLKYKETKDGYDIQVLDKYQKEGWAKCTLGTAGGTGTGGLGGAGVGSAVPGIGTVAGGIVGGVSGAATGAAASCF
ncbi:hypothetical protein BUY86_10620 [Staphylococcus equorum]|nr:hypothetical protein BUY86_10620 [Staphylococcus equorum]